MCYNSTVSIAAFLSGFVFSILLICLGNPEYKRENRVFGVLLLFIAGIQFMESLFWIDLTNKMGINKLATVTGSLFNMGQPLLIYIIKVYYYRVLDIFMIPNIVFFLYLIWAHYKFIVGGKLTTSELVGGHLRWPWVNYMDQRVFLVMFAINMFYLTDFNYSFIMFSIVYGILAFATVFFPHNVAEFWCFLSTSVPAIMLPLSYYILYTENRIDTYPVEYLFDECAK